MYILHFIYIKTCTSENRESVSQVCECTLVVTCNTHSSTNIKYFIINAYMILYFNPIFTYVPFFHHPITRKHLYIYIIPSSQRKFLLLSALFIPLYIQIQNR